MTGKGPSQRPALSPEQDVSKGPKENGSAPLPEGEEQRPSFTVMALQTALPEWLQTVVMVSLIFGGCCSNVFTLEAIIESTPDAGLLITFTQFVLVALYGWSRHFSMTHPPFFVVPNRVPLSRWALNILLFFSINVLNNHAFAYRISVPVHIILRSGGSVATMVVGYIYGKRFSRTKVVSVALLTVGVVISAMADARAQGKSTDVRTDAPLSTFVTGLAILFVAQVLSAVMGLYVQETYAKYGTHWEENVFYTHMLSLPLFLPTWPSMRTQFQHLASSAPLQIPLPLPIPTSTTLDKPLLNSPYLTIGRSSATAMLAVTAPTGLIYLVANAATQFACIRGVNKLAARSSALAVTIVLNIRKLASLLLSIWLFGNQLAPGVLVGAVVVFGAGALYASDNSKPKKGGEKERVSENGTKKVD